jgi:predicted aldo/keto reductase-like oxidoreductase
LNFVLWSIPEYRRDAQVLLDTCRQRDVGVHIIKTLAKDPWGERPKTHTTWYEPFTDQAIIDQAVAFVLSQPVTTLCSVGDVTVLPKFLAAAEGYRPLSPEAQEALVGTASQYHSPFVGSWA